MSKADLVVSVVAFQEGGGWIGQCLEYDITAQAETLPDLQYELQRVLISHVVVSKELGIELFSGLSPAPRRYWEMYEQAKMRVERDELPFRLPQPTGYNVAPRVRIAEQSASVAHAEI